MREIIRYTSKQWGDAQVLCYITKLEQGIARLAVRQGDFKEMSALYPALRMAHCEHHYVFLHTTRACSCVDRRDIS